MATVSAAAVSGGKSRITGTGHTGPEIVVSVAFASNDGKRRYVENYRVPVSGGALGPDGTGYDVPVPIGSGTVTVKAHDAAGALLATATGLSV